MSTHAEDVYDYVLVGAGSAGCVLAARLSADPSVRVLVLEAGPPDGSIILDMPAAFSMPLAHDRFNWFYTSEPEPGMDGRRMYCPRGRVIGGSSSINGMCYVRGHAYDYDRWAAGGLAGWAYRDCLPYFRRAETRASGADEYRGGSGPLHVSTGACENPLYRAYIEAGRQAGHPVTDDMNGRQQEGFGPMDMTVHRGRRWSAARAYLDGARRRRNLRVRSRALVQRVRLEGSRATGVEYVVGGTRLTARALREVILCGGAINSPQLLMLSGLGPADHLREHGIAVVADLPGVGANLQDHLEVYVQQACTEPVTLYPALGLAGRLRVGLRWLVQRSGPGASNLFEAGAFLRSRPDVEHPDLQHHFLPVAVNYDGTSPAGDHGYQVHVGPMRPTSRGEVRLRSGDPAAAPMIRFGYMSTETDRAEMRAGVRLTREVLAQPAFDRFRGPEISPGAGVTTDAGIDAFVRAHAESAYHPCGTAAMGTGADSVVDADARVHDVESLRVVDASIMPTIVSGNLNAPTIMMAEKLADVIRGREPLAPSDAPVGAPAQ